MTTVLENNKAKTARRVIEVLEFFDDEHREATVMDIVRRYDRPQSSTSELLASLVELGLLYKDPGSRSYTLTPRAAILGSLAQPAPVRDGTLSLLIDRLVAQTGLGTALFGMVGLNAQIFRWSNGTRYPLRGARDLHSGVLDGLANTPAGWLLLATIKPERREGVIRRLNAEADDAAKFSTIEMSHRVQEAGRLGYAIGPSGFGINGQMTAVLLPAEADGRPMVLGFLYQPGVEIDAGALVTLLRDAVKPASDAAPAVEKLTTAA